MKNLFTVFSLLVFSFIYSQKTITGVIKNDEGSAVSNASITVEEAGRDAIMAYAISNSKGEYKLSFTSAEPLLDLKIKAFNHKTQVVQIKNESQTHNFTLQTQATEIKEVVMKTKMITKKGDTISYDLKAFETKNDRTLADVLKRMPGVEVNKDGSILYQGQPLGKFYVNGKDLMEGGYGVINNALPKDAVQKVEVMENHQPVKILKDKVPTEQAAINIKLKSKVTMTGRGEVGSGIADPWLWNLKLTPMFFGQKNQWVVNYKTNNVGETVENEGVLFAMGNRWEGRRSNASQTKWLSVENAYVPNLPEKRYLMNNVHFITANVLNNPFKNKEWELKISGNYTNNAVERESYNEMFDKQKNLYSYTTRRNNFYTNKAKAEIIFTKNAKKGFFKNTTTFNQFWNADRGMVDLRSNLSNKNADQALESPTTSFQNSLSTIIPLKTKMLNVMSYISYQNDRQSLEVTPGNYVYYPASATSIVNNFQNTDVLQQIFKMKSFDANHSATIGFTKKYWTFTPEVGLNFSSNQMQSDLYGYRPNMIMKYEDRFSNALQYTQTIPYVGVGINYKSDSWTIGIQAPVNLNLINAKDPSKNLDKSLTKTTFEPNGFVQYSFASFWKAMLTGGISNNFASPNDLYAGLLLSNPRSFGAMNANNPMLQANMKRIGTRLEYRNPLNNLFFNVNYSYSNTRRNLITDITDNGIGFGIISYREMNNTAESHSQNAEFGKYFPKLKTNASLTFRNSNSLTDNFRNTTFFVNTNNTQNYGFKFNNSYFSWMTLDYNFTLGWSKNSSILGNTQSDSFNHNLSVVVFPIENHSIGFNWDQINYAQNGEKYNNGFYDLSYQFAWTKKKIDFEVKWMNIANQRNFEMLNDTATTTTLNRVQIRPSQVMLTVKFNFK